MVNITSTLSISTPNIVTRMAVSDGTPPYTFTTSLGVVGTTGTFSSTDYGSATITVTDSTGATSSTGIDVLNILQILSHIISVHLELDSDQIFLYNQRFLIPSDQRVYVSISTLDCLPFSNNISTKNDVDDTSIQSTNFRSTVRVELFSSGLAALHLKEHFQMSLASDYSLEVQDFLNIHISKIPTAFNDSSYREGVNMLYRFSIDVPIQYSIAKTIPRNFYDQFSEPKLTTG